MRPAYAGTIALLALACSEAPSRGASSSSAAASAPSPPPRASAAPSAAAAPATAATGSAAAPPPSFEPTEEPELAEWAKSKIVKVPGSTANECETRMVREWLRIMCVPRSAELGKPARITIHRGRAPNERSKGENLKAVNDITTLIVPVRPGTDLAATFEWENGSHALRVGWPSGAPETARVMEFDNAPSPADSAGPSASGAAPPPPPEDAAAISPKPEPPLDDVASLAPVPDDATWDAAPEVAVKGSSAAGCETKVSGDWFRAKCAPKGAAGAVQTIVPLKGHRKTQTTSKIDGDTAVFFTPYVEGTETHARFDFAGGRQFLVLRWAKGPKPRTVGAFETGK